MKNDELKPIEIARTRDIVAWTSREIKSGDIFIENFREYFESTPGKVLSLAGFASYLGCSPQAFASIKEKFPEQFGFAKQVIEKTIIEGALTGNYNASFSQFLLKNSFDGYASPDIEINQINTSPEEIDRLKESLREARKNKNNEKD